MSLARVDGPVEALYRRSSNLPGQPGRAVLKGRLDLESLLGGNGSRAGDVRRILHLEELREALTAIAATASVEAVSMIPDSVHALQGLRSSRGVDLGLLERGVKGYLLYEPGWATDVDVATEVRHRIAAGAGARIIDRVPHRLTVFDRKVAILPIDPTLREPGMLLVRERSLVASLLELFVAVWQRSVPFDGYRPLERDRTRERKVLEQMSLGVTDENAARELEVSLRTYRRWVAEVMSALGATSRFQAGVRAVERGWL